MTKAARHFASLVIGASLLMGSLSTKAVGQAQPRDIEVEGLFIHPDSRAAFPEKTGPLHRVSLIYYDDTNQNLSAGYQWENRDARMGATAYVYPKARYLEKNPSADPVQAAFKEAVASIKYAHKGVKLIHESAVKESVGEETYQGYKAEFDIEAFLGRPDDKTKSAVMVFGAGKWLVKFRFTYTTDPEKTSDLEQRIIQGMTWPE